MRSPSTEFMETKLGSQWPKTIRSSLASVRTLMKSCYDNCSAIEDDATRSFADNMLSAFMLLISIALKINSSSRSMAAITLPSKGEFMMKPVIVLCTRKAYAYGALQVSKLRLNQNGC